MDLLYLWEMEIERANSFQVYFKQQDYLVKVIEQVRRDFNMSGLDFRNGENLPNDYKELFNSVLENLVDHLRSNQLNNLLYRIDIPESSIVKRAEASEKLEFEHILCGMIIERCLLKVLTREKYS
jgi:hypothetical protein